MKWSEVKTAVEAALRDAGQDDVDIWYIDLYPAARHVVDVTLTARGIAIDTKPAEDP